MRISGAPAVMTMVCSVAVLWLVVPAAADAAVPRVARSARPSGWPLPTWLVPQATGNVTDHGGPVQTKPIVYIDYWGWSKDPDGEKAYLTNFLKGVASSPYLKTVTQYSSAGADPSVGGTWSDPSTPPSDPTGQQFADEDLAAAGHFGFTIGSNMTNDAVLIALPNGVSLENTGPGDCAYHTYATLTQGSSTSNLPFIALPYLPTYDPSGCGSGYVNPGNDLDGVSIVAGHELAETITDPLLNAWYHKNTSGEIADECVWSDLADAMMTSRLFAVQPLWSNAISGCQLATKGSSSWSPQATIPSQHTGGSPSYAFDGGTLWAAYRGQTSDNVYVQPDTYKSWGTRETVTGASTTSSPSITDFSAAGDLVAAWTDSATAAVETSESTNGSSWTSLGVPDGGNALSSTGPAICANGHDLYAAFKGNSTDNVYISVWNGSWQPEVQLPGASTTQAPTLACDGVTGTETIAWTNSADGIDYATFNGSSFGSTQAIPSAGTNSGPSLAASASGVLTAAWNGTSTNDVFYSSLVSGSWTTETTVPKATTGVGPAIAWAQAGPSFAPGSTLIIGWTGKTSQAVYFSGSNNP